jgi:hypothetical protein
MSLFSPEFKEQFKDGANEVPVLETPVSGEQASVENKDNQAPVEVAPPVGNTPNTEKQQVVEPNVLPDSVTAKLKESGYDTLEALIEAAKKPKEADKVELTPEEKIQKENEAKLDFTNHAVKVAKLSPDYLNKVEALLKADAVDVVFPEFEANYKSKNPDADAEDIKFAFDSQFPISSDDDAVKEQALRTLNLWKDKIVNEQSSDYNKVQKDYNYMKEIQAHEPVFKKDVLDAIKNGITSEMDLGAGEDVTKFKSNITESDMFKHIEKELGADFIQDLFLTHLNGQSEQVSKAIKKITEWAQTSMIMQDALTAHGNTMKSKGLNEGALGSKAPFNTNAELGQPAAVEADLSRLRRNLG